jgi:redox-sensitive bicupin YhaK (pirin superfamily)
MYSGRTVPGVTVHRIYGFEAITITEKGTVDHHDSAGGTARYGNGDVQWLSAGRGVLHSEMFPLLNPDKPNPLELFQIWLNLPASNKKTAPTFTIGWKESQAVRTFNSGEDGPKAHLKVVTGSFCGLQGMPPPPNSYACDPKGEVVIAKIVLEPGAKLILPPASSSEINRTLYVFKGSSILLSAANESKPFTVDRSPAMIKLVANVQVELSTGPCEAVAEVLLLQGRPLQEPVFQSGPYVASTRAELMEVMMQSHHEQWPWERLDPVHHRGEGRFFNLKKDGERHEPTHEA